MRQLDEGREDRRWPDFLRLDRLRPLHGGPTIVSTFLHSMDRFPKFPADIGDEQLAGLAIEAHPPRVAEAVRPDLRRGALDPDERIVLRDGVVSPWACHVRLGIFVVHV